MLRKDSEQAWNRSKYYPLPRDLTFGAEKPLFRKWARGRKMLVEIGVFEGASGSHFRSVMARDATLHLIDPFIADSNNEHLVARPFFAHMNVERIRNGRVKWHRDFSYNVVKKWFGDIDFLFIDGNHTYDACLQDWMEWSPYVPVNGIVMFHDARFGKGDGSFWDGWEGPTQVVDKLFRGPGRMTNWEIVDEAGTVVVVMRVQ